jgi:glycosyltransferase involved in cell wall biosynthesis
VDVSLVIPVRNEEQSIARLLDCVLSQSLRPAELLIADCGSTDRTV